MHHRVVKQTKRFFFNLLTGQKGGNKQLPPNRLNTQRTRGKQRFRWGGGYDFRGARSQIRKIQNYESVTEPTSDSRNISSVMGVVGVCVGGKPRVTRAGERSQRIRLKSETLRADYLSADELLTTFQMTSSPPVLLSAHRGINS